MVWSRDQLGLSDRRVVQGGQLWRRDPDVNSRGGAEQPKLPRMPRSQSVTNVVVQRDARGRPERRPRDVSGRSARRRDDDDAGRGCGAVLRGRLETREDLDGEDVGGGDLLEHLQIVDGHVVEDHAYLVVLIQARPPTALDPGRLPTN